MPVTFDDPEEQRAYWRETSKRMYYANLDRERTRRREAARRYRQRKPAKPSREIATFQCQGCQAIVPRRTPSGGTRTKYCSAQCYRAHGLRDAIDRRMTAQRAAKVVQLTGQSCPVSWGECPECGELISLHGNRRYCSALCRTRFSNREYQRRTHVTAIRYWQVAPTPEARALAETYFLLRMELRHGPGQRESGAHRGGAGTPQHD